MKDIVAKGSERLMGKFFADAEQKLMDTGIAADRVEIITTQRKAFTVSVAGVAQTQGYSSG
jgi:hypothetical protein